MNKSTFNILGWFVPAGIFALLLFGCERDITDLDTLQIPKYLLTDLVEV